MREAGTQLATGKATPCLACNGKGVGVFTKPGQLTYSGSCPVCGGSGVATNDGKEHEHNSP